MLFDDDKNLLNAWKGKRKHVQMCADVVPGKTGCKRKRGSCQGLGVIEGTQALFSAWNWKGTSVAGFSVSGSILFIESSWGRSAINFIWKQHECFSGREVFQEFEKKKCFLLSQMSQTRIQNNFCLQISDIIERIRSNWSSFDCTSYQLITRKEKLRTISKGNST